MHLETWNVIGIDKIEHRVYKFGNSYTSNLSFFTSEQNISHISDFFTKRHNEYIDLDFLAFKVYTTSTKNGGAINVRVIHKENETVEDITSTVFYVLFNTCAKLVYTGNNDLTYKLIADLTVRFFDELNPEDYLLLLP